MQMRRLIYPLALAALAVALVPAATATTSKTVAVSITRSAFVPKSVTVTFGDAVKWTNNDTIKHEVRCTKCPFTSPVLNPGDSFTHKFKTIGKFGINDPLHTKLKGMVSVIGGPKSVTLTATPTRFKYGGLTMLSGQISSAKSGHTVALLSEECGSGSFAQAATTTTTAGGTFSFTQTPVKNTAYKAKWSAAVSPTVNVYVRPRIKLAKIGSHKYRVKVKAATSFVGKHVVFQRRTASGTWTKVKRVTLKTSSTVGTTAATKATFRSKIHHHKKVRMLMKPSQAGPCYIGNHSNVIRS
jgi:plastocyanin